MEDALRDETFAVCDLLNRQGPNRLLWVTRHGNPAFRLRGMVRFSVARGYSGQPADAPRFDPVLWLELCRNAYRAFAER